MEDHAEGHAEGASQPLMLEQEDSDEELGVEVADSLMLVPC